MRSQDPARDGLPVSGDAEWPLPAPRRLEHRAKDGGGPGEYPGGENQAWSMFEAGEDRTRTDARLIKPMPGDAGGFVM